jgi:hypothetical protein
LSAAAGLLQGFHAIIAMQRQEPHWLLNDADAKQYGQALANAARHLPIAVAQKYADYSAFVMVCFAMETPRIARSVQLAQSRRQGPPRGPAQVFQFRPPQPAPNPPAGPTTTGGAPQTATTQETAQSPDPFPDGLGLDGQLDAPMGLQ